MVQTFLRCGSTVWISDQRPHLAGGDVFMPSTGRSSLDAIREQAAGWVDRQFAGRLSEQDIIEFDVWRKADERHEECVRMCIASRWAELMRDGNISAAEREAFNQWQLADPRNVQEYLL